MYTNKGVHIRCRVRATVKVRIKGLGVRVKVRAVAPTRRIDHGLRFVQKCR